MPNDSRRFTRERRTIRAMIGIYCRDHHESTTVPCATCKEFEEYAFCRLQRCPFGDKKPTCAKCPIHCYKPAMREQAKTIMRYAGPRMLRRHPILAIRHLLDGLRSPRELGQDRE